MSKSIWNIIVIGFVTVILMVVLMLVSLTAFQGSPAANRARLANQIRESFGFPEVAAGVKDIDGRLLLRIDYLAHTTSKFDDSFMTAEIRRVIAFVQENYDGREKRSIREIRVRRTEIQGKGCWQRRLERDLTQESPFPEPPPPLPGKRSP